MDIRSAALWLMLIGGVAQAQTFKGHRIGESTADFLKVEPSIQAKLTDCQANAPRELTTDELQKELGRKGYESYLKQEAKYNSEGKHIQHLTQDPDVYGFKCDAMLKALVSGTGGFDDSGQDFRSPFYKKLVDRAVAEHNMTLMPHFPPSDRSFEFSGGVLVRLSMKTSALYEDVRADMTARLGVNPTESRIPFHNAFGAQWNEIIAEWDSGTIYARLSQDNNPAKATPADVDVWSAEWHRSVLARQPPKPKPLD